MREIKFRVYSTVTGSFDYFTIKDILTKGCRKVSEKAFDEDLSIEQFTGLLDCNGVEIFDGDIIEYHPYYNLGHSNEVAIGAVEWGETGDSDGWAHGKHHEFTVNDDSLADIADSDYPEEAYCKVIGNIHQNSELLNE